MFISDQILFNEKSHTKCFETITKVDNQSSNISDEDIDYGDHDIGKKNCAFPSICRRNLGGNILAQYL